MTTRKMAGIIAAAAALAFVTAPVTSTLVLAHGKKVPCYGANACKGKSSCKTATSACKGKNDCKGKGAKMMTPKRCTKAGGTTEAPEAPKS